MRLRAGRITVTTGGTRVRFTTEADIDDTMKLLWIQFRGDPDNTNDVFVGIADVSASIGWSLENNDPTGIVIPIREIDTGKGSLNPDVFYFDVTTNGEKIDYMAIFE